MHGRLFQKLLHRKVWHLQLNAQCQENINNLTLLIDVTSLLSINQIKSASDVTKQVSARVDSNSSWIMWECQLLPRSFSLKSCPSHCRPVWPMSILTIYGGTWGTSMISCMGPSRMLSPITSSRRTFGTGWRTMMWLAIWALACTWSQVQTGQRCSDRDLVCFEKIYFIYYIVIYIIWNILYILFK